MLPYTPGAESAYDQSTYMGRVKHFQSLSNQWNFIYSNKHLAEMKSMLDDFEAGKDVGKSNEELWKAKYQILGNYHCQTNEPLPKLFRTSGFCLVNMPIILGLTFLPPTPLNQIIAQSTNQSYNFAYNFVNGNADNKYSVPELAFSYGMAVGSAICGSLGTLKLASKLNAKGPLKLFLNKFAPFVGVAVANQCNLFFSRINDFKNGISVANAKTGEVISEQNSLQAAKIAFSQTAVTRVVIPAHIFVIPGIWSFFSEKYKLLPKNIVAAQTINAIVGGVALYIGLTYALAIFPQNVVVKANQLEPYFQNLKDKEGNPIQEFTFNKGL